MIFYFLVAEEENREAEKKTTTKSPEEMLVEKAKFLMIQALEADESENNEDAVKLYTAAVEFCLDAVSWGYVCQAGYFHLKRASRNSNPP